MWTSFLTILPIQLTIDPCCITFWTCLNHNFLPQWHFPPLYLGHFHFLHFFFFAIKTYARKNYPNFFSDFLGISPTFSDSVFLYCMFSLDPNSLDSPSPVHSCVAYVLSCRNGMLELHHANEPDYHSIHRHASYVVYLYHETALVCTPVSVLCFIILKEIIRTIELLLMFSLI